MNRLLSKLNLNLLLLRCPVLINAYVYGEGTDIVHENWGDDINWFFLKEIVKRPIALFDRISLAMRLNLKNYLVIGSTIDMLCKSNTEVWGAGIIDGTKPLRVKPKKVHAVRGPLTRRKLIEEGVECPEVYGDPALLLPLYYKPNIRKHYRYGIVTHVSNQEYVENLHLDGIPLRNCPNVRVINLNQYKHWHDIINQICDCEIILSSSLHGLIVSEAYGVPNVWVEFGKPLIGGRFKFHDFFLSIQRDREAPILVERKELSVERIQSEVSQWERGKINIRPLINACPFQLKRAKYLS